MHQYATQKIQSTLSFQSKIEQEPFTYYVRHCSEPVPTETGEESTAEDCLQFFHVFSAHWRKPGFLPCSSIPTLRLFIFEHNTDPSIELCLGEAWRTGDNITWGPSHKSPSQTNSSCHTGMWFDDSLNHSINQESKNLLFQGRMAVLRILLWNTIARA